MAPKLEPIGEGLWAARRDVKVGGGLILPGRMLALAGDEPGLLLWSPFEPTHSLREQLEHLGGVRGAMAPNGFHNLHIAKWSKLQGNIRIAASSRAARKHPEMRVDERLEGDWHPSDAALDGFVLQGIPAIDEAVLLHRPSRSVIVVDLVFNVDRPRNFISSCYLALSGTRGRLAQSRLMKSLIKDREALARSYERVLDWDFDRLVMAHGEVVETGGKDALRRVLGV